MLHLEGGGIGVSQMQQFGSDFARVQPHTAESVEAESLTESADHGLAVENGATVLQFNDQSGQQKKRTETDQRDRGNDDVCKSAD